MIVSQTDRLYKEALELSPIERASLIDRIIESFDFTDFQSNEKLWAEEVENRISDYKSGKIKASSADEVFANINI